MALLAIIEIGCQVGFKPTVLRTKLYPTEGSSTLSTIGSVRATHLEAHIEEIKQDEKSNPRRSDSNIELLFG
jgi:hypothetical protein